MPSSFLKCAAPSGRPVSDWTAWITAASPGTVITHVLVGTVSAQIAHKSKEEFI